MCAFESLRDFSRSRLGWDDTELARESVPWSQEALMCNCVFRTNVTGDFGIVTEDSGPS